jgi:hypothetical protein
MAETRKGGVSGFGGEGFALATSPLLGENKTPTFASSKPGTLELPSCQCLEQDSRRTRRKVHLQPDVTHMCRREGVHTQGVGQGGRYGGS